MHIVDISHPDFEEQIEVVNKTLDELESRNKPTILVFNKIDAYQHVQKDEDDLTPLTRENITLEELQNTWMSKMQNNCFFISAKNLDNMETFKSIVYERVKEIHVTRFPYNDFLFQKYDESEEF